MSNNHNDQPIKNLSKLKSLINSLIVISNHLDNLTEFIKSNNDRLKGVINDLNRLEYKGYKLTKD